MAFKRILVLTLLSIGATCCLASSGSAATLHVVAGQLFGASNVSVGGNLFDVEFRDGSCQILFTGCDSVSDFTFQTSFDATLASQALLNQVFLDGPQGLFDTFSTNTTGCAIAPVCKAYTPYALTNNNRVVFASADNGSAGDRVAVGGEVPVDYDPSPPIGSTEVYALWSPVPEPGTALLMGLGLVGLGLHRRTVR